MKDDYLKLSVIVNKTT